MRSIFSFLSLFLCLVIFNGCGVILSGSTQTIDVYASPGASTVSTEPPTAEYTTPTVLELSKKHSYTLTFEKDGYKPATFHIKKKLKVGTMLLDVVLTGLIGVIIDASTGGWNKLTPESVTVTLEKIESSSLPEMPDKIIVEVKPSEDGKSAFEITSDYDDITVEVEQVK